MGNSQGQLKSSKFETALHMSIEQSLRTSSNTPHPLFSQLYLEKDIKLTIPDVLPTTSDLDRGNSPSPRGSIGQESVQQRCFDAPTLPPRLISSLPAIPGPMPVVHGPLQGVIMSPRLPASSLDYLPQGFLLPGHHPSPHAIPPMICNVPPSLPSSMQRDRPFSPRRGHSPREERMEAESSRPVMLGGCQEVGFCQAGGDIRLSKIHDKHIHIPNRFVLVGATTPYLPEDILVAAVDTRFLPGSGNSQALHLAGFNGNCIGCGKKGFRYFTEFAHHINLKLMSEAKKENHLRYYIETREGRKTKGSLIPWQEHSLRRTAVGEESGRIAKYKEVTEDLIVDSPPPLSTVQSMSYEADSSSTPSKAPLPSKRDIDQEEELDGGRASKQPPKKRHRFHSLSEEKTELPIRRRISLPHSSEFLPPPPDVKDSTFVPPSLAHRCGTKVVILSCRGTVPVLHGHISDICISTLFQGSFDTEETTAASSDNEVLRPETKMLLLMNYLLQTGSRLPNSDEFDQILARARLEASSGAVSHEVTSEELPSLAQLAAVASYGKAHVTHTESSLSDGISRALQYLITLPSTDRPPQYVFVLSTQGSTQFCVIVSGPLQARSMIERSSAGSLKECSTASIHLLTTHFTRSSPGLDLDDLIAEFSCQLKGMVFAPFNASSESRVDESIAAQMKPTPCEGLGRRDDVLHPSQIQAAMKVLSRVCAIADQDRASLDLGRFTEVRLLIVVPPSDALYEQTVERLHSSKLVLHLGVVTSHTRQDCGQFVMKLDDSDVSWAKYEEFLGNVKSMTQTLFVMIQDQAHLTQSRLSQSGSTEITDAPNVLCLHVSSLPYCLQTRNSSIPVENEIFMEEDPAEGESSTQPRYFGMRDYQQTMQWTDQVPLLQSDETFEQMAESLLTSYTELHTTIVRTYLLVQQYSMALVNAAAQRSLSGTTDRTATIVHDLIAAPLRNQYGRGHMVLLRIPSTQLAVLAHQRLKQVRNGLGLHYRFEVLLRNHNTALEVEQHFLQRMQAWRDAGSSWKPVTYEDLEGLPCIMIHSGKDTMGETMPRSLKVVDLRLVNEGMFDLTSLEQELGLACAHIDRVSSGVGTMESEETSVQEQPETEETFPAKDLPFDRGGSMGSPMMQKPQKLKKDNINLQEANIEMKREPPLVLVSKQVLMVLTTAHSQQQYSATLPPSAGTRWISSVRPLMTSDSGEDKSSYLREWTDLIYHNKGPKDHPRQFLLSGPPQVGKTGAYLHFCRILSHMLIKLREIEVNDDRSSVVPVNRSTVQGVPDLSLVKGMTFDLTLYQERYKQCSLIWHPGLDRQDLNRRASPTIQNKKKSTMFLQSTKLSAHNSFHRCDECQSYRIGDGSQIEKHNTHNLEISDAVFGEVSCQFVIPPRQKANFVFDRETGTLISMRLSLIGEQDDLAVKSPIFTIVRNKTEQSLVNMYHVMDGCKYVHVLVCREKDSVVVRKQWPCHTVLVLPAIANSLGSGGMKYFVQQIARHNLKLEKQRNRTLGMDPGKVWPFILIMEDCLVSWRKTETSHEAEVSLKSVMDHMETLSDVTHYALLGIDQWNSKSKTSPRHYNKSFVDNMVFLNVELTDIVQYKPYRFFNEDIDFSWRVNARQLPICRLSYLQVMVKTNLSEKHPPDIVVHPSTPTRTAVTTDKFLIPLDSEGCTLLSTTPHYLVEKYLSDVALTDLLVSDVDLVTHPVLVLDEYISLGPNIPVCIISSTSESSNVLTDVTFSGLAIDGCINRVPQSDFIGQFKFITGAHLLVILPTMASARKAIVELDLERRWKLQVLQTANASEDQPIVVLKGIYREETDSSRDMIG